MVRNGLHGGVDHEPHRNTLHQWKQLVLTRVECAGSVVV